MFIVKWTTAMRVVALAVVLNHTWQLIVWNSKVQKLINKIEITSSNVIKDAVQENNESDHDSSLLNNRRAFVSTESL